MGSKKRKTRRGVGKDERTFWVVNIEVDIDWR